MVWRFTLSCPEGRWDSAHRIRTEVMPRAEVLRMEPPEIDNLMVDMKVLAETDMGGFAPLLMPLVDDYEAWIAEKSAYFADEPEELRDYRIETAVVQAEWVEALERIKAGIALLDADARCGARLSIRQSRYVAAANPFHLQRPGSAG